MNPLSARSSKRYFVAGKVIERSLDMSARVVRAFLDNSFNIMRSFASNPSSFFEDSFPREGPRPLVKSSSHWFQSNLQVLFFMSYYSKFRAVVRGLPIRI